MKETLRNIIFKKVLNKLRNDESKLCCGTDGTNRFIFLLCGVVQMVQIDIFHTGDSGA